MATIESILDAYAVLTVLTFLVCAVGWLVFAVLYILGAANALGWLGFRNRAHDRVLREHGAACATCLYPATKGKICPECGTSYAAPNALIFRELDPKSRPLIPLWLRVATVTPLVLLATLFLTPLAVAAGNQIYWGAVAVKLQFVSAELEPQPGAGSPGYTLQINADVLVRDDLSSPGAPIEGQLYIAIDNNRPKPEASLRVDVVDRSWTLTLYDKPPPAPPHVSATGQGADSAAAAIFRDTQLANHWTRSAEEQADVKRLIELVLSDRYQDLESPSSQGSPDSGLRFTARYNSMLGRPKAYALSSQPGNPLSITLAGVALSIPLIAAAVFSLRRLLRSVRAHAA